VQDQRVSKRDRRIGNPLAARQHHRHIVQAVIGGRRSVERNITLSDKIHSVV
jgi:hypothetical protein